MKKISVISVLLIGLLGIMPFIFAYHSSDSGSSWNSWNKKCWPSYETCDGKDNDCDGKVDENNGNCDDDELCKQGNCIPKDDGNDNGIRCRKDNDCGTDKFLGDSFCKGGDVYKNFKVFSCINSGKKSSFCETQVDPLLIKDCKSSEKCSSGKCVPKDDDDANTRCKKNSDCEASGFTGSKFCQDGDVYQNYKQFTCNNPGKTSSACNSESFSKLVEDCPAGCSDGKCKKKQEFELIKEVTARFEGDQGPWDHVRNGNADSPTLALSSLNENQKIKVDDVRGTFSYRIYHNRDYLPAPCTEAYGTFTDSNRNTIKIYDLTTLRQLTFVPAGATYLYVHIKDNPYDHFDNSGRRDYSQPCEVDLEVYEKR